MQKFKASTGSSRLLKLYKKSARRLQRLQNATSPTMDVRRKIKLLSKRLELLSGRLNPLNSQRVRRTLNKIAGGLTAGAAAGIAAAMLGAPAAHATSLTVTTLSPTRNAQQVSSDANVAVTFSKQMNTTKLKTDPDPANANLIVYGSLSGNISTNAVNSYFDGDTKVVVNPVRALLPGEEFTVIVKDVEADDTETLQRAGIHSFRAGSFPGPATFMKNFPGESGSFDFELGDMDRDGDVDIVYTSSGGGFNILLNDGAGNEEGSESEGEDVDGFVVADFNGDGFLDVLGHDRQSPDHFAKIFLNNGDVEFATSSMLIPKVWGTKMKVGDMDNDGDLDVIFAQYSANLNALMLMNNGDGTFTTSPIIDPPRGYSSAIGDIDNDGDLDFILPAASGSSTATKIYKNNGDATFVASTFGDSGPRDIELADLDGDGDLDAFLAGTFSTSAVWKNNGDGTFTSSDVGGYIAAERAQIADIDGDGDLDLIVATAPNFIDTETPIELFLNNGDGTFVAKPFGAMEFGCSGRMDLAIADMDGDGDLDVVTNETVGFCCNFRLPIYHQQIVAPDPLELDDLSGECVFTSSDAVPLNLSGAALNTVTSAVLTLPGSQQLSLVVTSSTASALATEIPAGSATTAGLYTVSLFGPGGSTSSTFTLKTGLTLSGPECGCPEVELAYSVTPGKAGGESNNWIVEGGEIVSGLGSDEIVIEWDQSSVATLTLERVSSLGDTTRKSLDIDAKTLIVRPEYRVLMQNEGVNVNPLANDEGDSLSIKTVFSPSNGSASKSGGDIEYDPASNFNGIDVVEYVVEDSSGCQASGQLVLVVGEACLPGNLNYIESKKNSAGMRGLRKTGDVIVSPNGKHVYAAGRNDHSVVLFNRNTEDGTLSYVGRWRHGSGGVSGLKYVSHLAFSADGAHLYATGFGNNAVVVFSRNSSDGNLTFVERQNMQGSARPKGIAVSADGNHVYVAASKTSAIEVYSRNSGTGELTYVERQKDGQSGVDGIRSAADVSVSPDGKHVYAAGPGDNAVAVFARNSGTGALTYVERLKDGSAGVDGLSGAIAVSVASNGKHVYVAGSKDDAVAVFARNDSSGSLTYQTRLSDRDSGIAGLDGAADVALGPDGLQVFVPGTSDNAMGHFTRKPQSGNLSFVERKKDARDGVDGLRGAKGVNTSPDSRYVYVAGAGDNAVAVFYRNLSPVAQDDMEHLGDFEQPELGEGYYGADTLNIDVLANDVEIDGDHLKITSITQPDIASVSINSDSTSIYYITGFDEIPDTTGGPEDDYDTFTYTVNDGEGGSSTATVRVAHFTDFEKQTTPDAFPLGQNPNAMAAQSILADLTIAPNPSAGSSQLSFQLLQAAQIDVVVRDITGRQVANLLHEQFKPGEYLIDWNGTSQDGSHLPHGTYYVVIRAQDGQSQDQQVIPFVRMK